MSETENVTLKDLSVKELRELAKMHNAELGASAGDLGYIATSSPGAKLIAELSRAEELNVEPARNDVETRSITVTADKIVRHPGNYRDEKDYHDPLMMEAFIRSGGEFFGALTVAPNDDNTYRIISGNRSFASFEAALNTLGKTLSDVEITCQERVYTGDERERRIAELADMGLANELQRPMSPIDLMHWYTDLSAHGLTQSAIAEIQYGKANAANKVPQISIILGYSRLPEEFLSAMHNEFNRHEYAANGEEWLEAEGVPYYIKDEAPVVVGLSAVNANEICKLYPRRGSTDPEAPKLEAAVNKLLTSNDEVLENACTMTASEFKSWLSEAAIEAGLKERRVARTKPAETSEGFGDESPDDTGEASEAAAASTPATKSKGGKAAYLKYGITGVQAAYDISTGAVLLTDDALDRLGELCDVAEDGAAETFMFLLHHGIIEENV
jgi:hypothetical protein